MSERAAAAAAPGPSLESAVAGDCFVCPAVLGRDLMEIPATSPLLCTTVASDSVSGGMSGPRARKPQRRVEEAAPWWRAEPRL